MGHPAMKPVPQAPAVPTPVGSLVLSVTDPTGAPIKSKVTLFYPKTGDTFPFDTDAFGHLTVPNLPSIEMKITIDPGPTYGLVPDPGAAFKEGPVTDTITILPGPEPTVESAIFTIPKAYLRVLVEQPHKNGVLPNVPVRVDLTAGLGPFSASALTDKAGLTMVMPVPPGSFHIMAGVTEAKAAPFFGPDNSPQPVVLGSVETDRTVHIGEMVVVRLLLEEKRLQIVRIDDHFAPSKESLDIHFAIRGIYNRQVKLIVEGENYPGKVMVSRDIPKDKTTNNNDQVISWDGKIEEGELKDHFANPLMGPFKAILFHDDAAHTNHFRDEKKFKILYHSLELKEGPWTPDEKEPDKAAKEKEWIQYKLNQLGFYGGPVGKDTEGYLEKAILRYKANHKKMYQFFVVNYRPDTDQVFKDALAAGDNKRPYLAGNPFPGPGNTGKILVEALYYQRVGAELKSNGGDTEFRSVRSIYDEKRLNRPLIPVEATVYLKGKDNTKKLVPDAVGPLRVNFRVKGLNEDLSSQWSSTPASPSQTKKYLEAALTINNGRVGDNGDNCPSALNGLRKTAPGESFDMPFLLGDFYQPYNTARDAGQKVVFSTACVDKQFPLRAGKAGIFFRPSYIAGDDYQLRAEIDFTGHPNQSALEADHGATTVDKRLHIDTGTFIVKRFAKLAAVVNWPARSKNAPQWDLIQAEYARAHVELDVSAFATKSITDVLNTDEYLQAIRASGLSLQPGMSLHPNAYFGMPAPAQGSMNAVTYKNLLTGYCALNGFLDRSNVQMGAVISKKLRAEFPVGLILITINQHEPADVQADPENGNHSVVNRQFIAGYLSLGLADGVLFADLQDPEKVYYVIAHEFGHLFYLLHHENTGENNAAHHDLNDHNCLMSYSLDPAKARVALPFQTQGRYAPHFCGKCNLALRGWDHTSTVLPKQS